MYRYILKKINTIIESKLSKIEVRKLFVLLLLVFGSILIAVFVFSRYNAVYSAVYGERIEKLKYVADFALEILKDENAAVKSHKKTLAQAQSDAINVLKDVRFENNDYLWVTNYSGTMLHHPNPKMLGTDLRLFDDSKNSNYGLKLVEVPKLYGSGYVTYHWPKLGKDANKLYTKAAYVVSFKDWQWIIGTGVYVDDIKIKVIDSMFKSVYPIIIGSILSMLIFRYILWITVVTPIEKLVDKSLRLANNDLTVTLSEDYNNTEIGKLNHAFNKFVEFFKEKRDNERKLFLIHDNIDDVLLTVDESGVILSINPAIKKMFGYEQQELLGANVDLLTSPVLFAEDKENLCELKHSNGKYEILGIKKDEELFYIEINIKEFLYDEKKIFLLLIRDITEQKEVEKIKNEFVSVVSHELRTPLTSIRGSLGLLLSGAFPQVTGKVQSLIEVAHNNSLRLVNLINDILDMEKIEAGKMEFNFEYTKVSEIIEQTIAMSIPYASKFNVSLTFINNLQENTIFNIDRNRFTQILTNLLSNASKFSQEHGEVVVTANQINSSIQISVRDNGLGISPEFKNKIFDKFTQADASDTRKKGGTGLGLNICKSLTEKMNGKIRFNSELGKGTTFFLEFPTV